MSCSYEFVLEEWNPYVKEATTTLPETWSCPHEAIEGHEVCIFHVHTTHEKTETRLNWDDVRESFRAVLDDTSTDTHEFIGATLPDLDLTEEVVDTQLDFRCCTFIDPIDFTNTTFDENVDFSGSRFTAHLNLDDAEFRDDVKFYGCDFGGRLNGQTVRFGGRTLFARAEFSASVNLQDGTVFADEVVFSKATFESNAHFPRVEFEDRTFFQGATFENTADFRRSIFHDDAQFCGSTFKDVNFSEVRAKTELWFGNIGPDERYGAATFDDRAIFQGIECVRILDFTGCTFKESLILQGSTIGNRLELTRATLHDEVDLTGSTCAEIQYRPLRSEHGPTIVRGHDTTVESGRCAQPLHGTAFFDFQQATIGNVEFLDTSGTEEEFSHTRSDLSRVQFIDTRFEGFDFTRYRPELEKGWTLHTFQRDHPYEVPEMDNETKEMTYMRAKTGANDIGDNRAAAGFFIREMRARRGRYRTNFRESNTLSEYYRTAYHYGGNWLFDKIAVYAERPVKVLRTSGVYVIGGFSLIYLALVQLSLMKPPYPETPFPIGYVMLSGESFVSLIHSPAATISSWPVRLITIIEGFLGAFLIALFLFTLTRAVHR